MTPHLEQANTLPRNLFASLADTCLYNGDGYHEPRWGAAGVAVVIPLPIDLTRQSLIRNVADQPLGKAQSRLLQQGLAAQPPVPLQDGLAKAVGPFVTHLEDQRKG